MYKPSYYGCITDKEMRHIFRSDTHVELSLISSRRKNLVEAAQVLNKVRVCVHAKIYVCVCLFMIDMTGIQWSS